jgi:glycopeptide antibiotics resistance protein
MNIVNQIFNKIAIYCLIFGILLILIMTLFPYDFFFWEILSKFNVKELFELLTKSSSKSDIILNLLLFIPFGFGLHSCLNSRNINNQNPLFLIAIASLLFSLIVEFLQFFLPGRTSTPIDLFTNTLSGVSGYLIYHYWGQFIFNQFNLFLNWIKRLISIPRLTFIFLFYLILTLSLSLPLQNTRDLWSLENWNINFPLNLGNELTGDRPWNGKINQFCLINKIALNPDIQQVFTSENPCKPFYNDPGIILNQTQIYSSPIAITQLNQRISQTSELTLAIQLSTADINQTGPARIISISKDLFQRNLTLGQWRSHLSIRIRNTVTGENGTQPELIIPNVFSDLKQHTILLLYRPDKIRFYINNISQEYELSLTPEMALFWQLSPVRQGSIHLNSWNIIFYKTLYYCLIFLPLGICFRLIHQRIKRRLSFDLLFLSITIIFPIIIFEVLLSLAGDRIISWINLLLSFAMTLIGFYWIDKIEKMICNDSSDS